MSGTVTGRGVPYAVSGNYSKNASRSDHEGFKTCGRTEEYRSAYHDLGTGWRREIDVTLSHPRRRGRAEPTG
jgi:hypothetical protein